VQILDHQKWDVTPSDTSNNKNRKADADTPVPIAEDSEDEALSMSDMLPANLENAR
jgi:hypothetical protein